MMATKKKLVVLSGAGISAESGLKTFRDSDGLWEGYNVQEVATPGAWQKDPQLVLEFYNMRRRDIARASPNAAHVNLARLEQDFDVHIITQNIDDLHERAGSSRVVHLHGEIFKMRSEKNETLIHEIRGDIRMGDCAEDGAQLRPHIVWFEENVPMIGPAAALVRSADIFVVIGTSLLVYPAAGLLQYAGYGAHKFIIDKKIPALPDIHHLKKIEKAATLGTEELIAILRERF